MDVEIDETELVLVKEFLASQSPCTWEELNADQRHNWVQLYRGDADWDGNPTDGSGGGRLISLDLRRRYHPGHRAEWSPEETT